MGHAGVVGMLETAEKDSKFAQLHAEMLAPKNRKASLVALCRKLNIRWDEMIDFHRNYNVQRGLLRASNHVPQIIDDVAVDSKSRSAGCMRCDGAGKLPDPAMSVNGEVHLTKDCPDCEGKGVVRVPGDQGSRTLLFEMLGLTGKSKGPLVAQQFNFNGSGVEPLANVVGAIPKLIGGR